MSATATAAPSRASAFEMASPMPRAPPVTSACLPFSLMSFPPSARTPHTAALYGAEKVGTPDLPTLQRDFESGKLGVVGVGATEWRPWRHWGNRGERVH